MLKTPRTKSYTFLDFVKRNSSIDINTNRKRNNFINSISNIGNNNSSLPKYLAIKFDENSFQKKKKKLILNLTII